jgi:hypothetical protein
MIDWTKPIETVDGRKVNWVADLIDVGAVIYVYPVSSGNPGDVFIVSQEGVRCDDRALFSARQEPFIRNVKVKKEGWVLIRPPVKTLINLSALLATYHVYPSEAEAREAMDYYSVELGTKPVHLTWEE